MLKLESEDLNTTDYMAWLEIKLGPSVHYTEFTGDTLVYLLGLLATYVLRNTATWNYTDVRI